MKPENASEPFVTDPKPESGSPEEYVVRDAPAAGRLPGPEQSRQAESGATEVGTVELRGLHAYYGTNHAVRGIDLRFESEDVTAIIGPSGCGKSTMVRCINRMHEEIPSARAEGEVLLDEIDLYDPAVDVVAVRRSIGMVFQKPNPFPTMSIEANVASGLRLTGGKRSDIEERVRRALEGAGLWEEVKDRLDTPAPGSPAANSSDCASRGRSRSIRRCC